MELNGKRVLVVGASRGLGRSVALKAADAGAQVWGFARDKVKLSALAAENDRIASIVGDMTDEAAASAAISQANPEILVLAAGATPTMAEIIDQSWDNFSANWNADTRASFNFGRAALALPMGKGSTFVTLSSGAAISGSFASGGYAGAKRMQWFLSSYFQKASDDRDLGIRFMTILPKQQFKETELGHAASSGYAKLVGVTQEQFLSRFQNALTPDAFAGRLWETVMSPDYSQNASFAISGAGIEKLE